MQDKLKSHQYLTGSTESFDNESDKKTIVRPGGGPGGASQSSKLSFAAQSCMSNIIYHIDSLKSNLVTAQNRNIRPSSEDYEKMILSLISGVNKLKAKEEYKQIMNTKV